MQSFPLSSTLQVFRKRNFLSLIILRKDLSSVEKMQTK